MRKVKKISASFPEQVITEFDQLAENWLTNRSAAIVRIYQEWKAARLAEETPIEQMKKHGCGPLPLVEA